MGSRTKLRILGGVFGFEEAPNPNRSRAPFSSGQEILFADARSGISLLVEVLSPPQVWSPSYLCRVMLDAAAVSTVTRRFYQVNYDLRVASSEWLSDVKQGNSVVLIGYVGFPGDSIRAAQAKGRGAWVSEDASHALLAFRVNCLNVGMQLDAERSGRDTR